MEIPAPEFTSLGPDGLAASRDHLFFVNGFGSNSIFKMTHDGEVVDIFPTFGGSLDGLAYSNGILYSLDYGSDRIFAFDPETGEGLWDVVVSTDIVGGLAPGPNGTLYTTEGLIPS